jgi:putative tryptophan/tyrosine transport system substrate-binding protein
VRNLSRRHCLRDGLALTGLALLAGCGLGPPAREPSKVHRLGLLAPDSAETAASGVKAITEPLAELGYVEGRNLVIEARFADGREERLPALAAELVRERVDLIVTLGTPAARAAQAATASIPIVINSSDPVGTGLVQSLARPGGNITGYTNYRPDFTGKKLEVLREILPGASRVAFLTNPNNPTHTAQEKDLEAAATALGIRLQRLEVRTPSELEGAVRAVADGHSEALVVLSDSLLLIPQRARIAELAVERRLPAMVTDRRSVEAGGLVSYTENSAALYRSRATIIDKILKGANPADLPVEGPARFDLILNLKTAQALGLTIPESALQQATELIQ